MANRLPQITSKKALRAFLKLGFVIRRQTGSHVILRHIDNKRVVCIPVHSHDLHRGLLFTILKQAEIGRLEFIHALD